jgi:rhodanese-related sulfurtransferase
MSPANVRGPGPADLSVPESLDAAELTRRLDDGEWVVDLRRRVAFASSHLKGSVSFEYGTGSSFTTYLGWVLPWGDPLTLVGSQEDLQNAIRDLSRIGIESPDAAVGIEPHVLAPQAALASYPRVGWDGVLAGRAAGDTVLDVRRADEFAASRVVGAVNVPLHELLLRLEDVPAGKLWVHCGSGYRAGVAASLLQRAGRNVVHIDARFADAESSGVPVDRTAA